MEMSVFRWTSAKQKGQPTAYLKTFRRGTGQQERREAKVHSMAADQIPSGKVANSHMHLTILSNELYCIARFSRSSFPIL